MIYKILLIFAITAATIILSLAFYTGSNAFAINESSSNTPNTTSSFALSAYNDSSTFKNNNQNYIFNLKDTEQQQNDLLITKLLAKNLENHLQKAGTILEITSKLPQVRDLPYANKLNQTLNTLHGIPQNADAEKRQVAKSIINSNSDLYEVFLLMPNGNIYFEEPYSEQILYGTSNLSFRDYFQGAIKTNDIYLGNVLTTATASGVRTAAIAVPVYSVKDNSSLVEVWAGGLDFNVLNKELNSLNITFLDNNVRIVYTGHLGQKVADSDVNKSKTQESFASLTSFKNAINGQSGSVIDTVDNTKMMVTYQPVKAFHNTWAILLMQPINATINKK